MGEARDVIGRARDNGGMSFPPHRVLPLQGASNFRDLGGYAGHDGRRVRWRRVFRSDHLGGLTAADHAALAGLGLARSFDFRGVHERAATPYEVPGLVQHSLAIEPTVAERLRELAEQGQTVTAAVAAQLMQELYLHLVNDNAHRYAELFDHLLASDAPAVFHCTAGKDRTGVAAALWLLALGVDRATVEADFLLTNAHFKAPAAPDSGIPADALAVMWRVQADFLHTALDAIERDHGGIERYLERRIGLHAAARRALHQRYLET
jgi:protein-tyrosine phosphatase